MYLVITEKPSVGMSIGKVLGVETRKEGFLEGTDCLISWCVGHLAEYASPDAYDSKYEKWNFEDLPILPDRWKLMISEDKKKKFYLLKKLLLLPELEYVVNACDAGREGELIFRQVYDLSGCTKPVKRLWINSMEDRAILDGFKNLKSSKDYDNLAKAAICRSKADWLIGMNATRAFTNKYYKLLRIGRVMTPTLSLLEERAKQIREFQKEKYFNVEMDCNGMLAVKKKIFDEMQAEELVRKCNGADAVVTSVGKTEKKKKPPLLYDLTTLQRDANRYYGLTAKQTLDLAQKLYEEKLITYPRTDSQYLPEDAEATARRVITLIHEKYHPLGPFDEPKQPFLKQVIDSSKVTDHHAILPTEELRKYDLHSLKETEYQVLFLIAIRLLMATDQEYKYEEISVQVESKGELFEAKGKKILQYGWKLYEECFKNDQGMAMEEFCASEKEFPEVIKETIFRCVPVQKTVHYTTPPKEYTEDTLLAAMETAGNKDFEKETEKKGLGTPATRASIIEKLVFSKYAVRKGKQISCTEDGKLLIEVVPDYLKSAALTAEWENKLLEMEKGNLTDQSFLEGIKGMVMLLISDCRKLSSEQTHKFDTRKAIGTCPVCGNPVYGGKKNFYCSNRDCSFVLWKENNFLEKMGKTMDEATAKALLQKGRVTMTDLYSAKKNKYFNADLVMEIEDGKARFQLEFPKNTTRKKEN